jgi:hypothetical protein
MPIPPIIGVLAIAALLAGCAQAVPGYVPPSFKTEKKGPLSAKPFDSGKVDQTGGYVVTEAETKLDCRKLTGSQHIAISRLEARQKSVPPSALAQTAQKASAPVLKQSLVGADLDREIAHERARFKAFNELLVSKKCQPVELPKHLAA